MAETKTYEGGCHWGKVRYRVATDLARVLTCNCSICSKHGLLLNFVAEDQFTQLAGDGTLTEYRFNKHVIQHLFCRACGVESFAVGRGRDGKQMYAVNVRCLDDIDLAALTLTPFDGKSL